MRFTGRRAEEKTTYDEIRRRGVITSDVYDAAIRDLERREKIAKRAAKTYAETKAAIEKEAKKAMKAKAKADIASFMAGTLAKVEAKREAKAVSGALIRVKVPRKTRPHASLYGFAQRLADSAEKRVTVRLRINGAFVRSVDYDFTGRSAAAIHADLARTLYFWSGSDQTSTVFAVDQTGNPWPSGTKIDLAVYVRGKRVPAKKMIQMFAEGAVNCVAGPVAALYDQMAANEEIAKTTRKRYRAYARVAREFGAKYPLGIPEGAPMEEFAQKVARQIRIYDVFGNVYQTYNEKNSRIFKFTNTRANHVDQNNITWDEKPTEVTREEMDAIVESHFGQFYTFVDGDVGVKTLRSARGTWKVAGDLEKAYEQMNAENNMRWATVDRVKYPRAADWLRASVGLVANTVRLAEGEPTGHIDMTRAYTQGKACRWYAGYLGVVHRWGRVGAVADVDTYLKDHFGIYTFVVLKNPVDLLKRLGLVEGAKFALPSPELRYYISIGLEVRLETAVWGAPMDLTYHAGMFEKVKGPSGQLVAPYKTWAGCLSYDRPTQEFKFKGTEEWAQHLTAIDGEDRVRWDGASGTISLVMPKRISPTKHHVLASIVSYVRIQMIEAMMTVPEVVAVQLDGIFYRGDLSEMPKGFTHKEAELPAEHGFTDAWFKPFEVDDAWMPLTDERLLRNCYLTGQGGCGKTYSVMTDIGVNDPVHIVPQHSLGQDTVAKYGAHYLTYHRLAGVDCQSFKEQTGYIPKVCVLDEITQVEAEVIEKILALYPDTLFYLAGDVERRADGTLMGFQTRNGTPMEGYSVLFDKPLPVVPFLTDRRSRDEALKEFKLAIRGAMREAYSDGGIGNAMEIAMWLQDNYPTVTEEAAIAMFKPGDTWIAGTHATNRRLLKAGVLTGYRCESGPDRGKVSRVPVDGWQARGSLTTHSLQGQTLTEGRVFVTLWDAFEHGMAYTAISRAVSMDQIVLINGSAEDSDSD
jgi:hypothetical protein